MGGIERGPTGSKETPLGTADIRRALDRIHRHCKELTNVSLSSCWPAVTKLVEAIAYPSADLSVNG